MLRWVLLIVLISVAPSTTPCLADNTGLLRTPLPVRGACESLPLWLGNTIYNNSWQAFEAAESDPDGAWLNRDHWRGKLENMVDAGLNALLLTHPHPYPGLLALDAYPDACWISPDQLAHHQEQFRWLLAEAKQRRIRVYLMTWNICLPERWAEANGLQAFGSDTPLSRKYTRDAVTALLTTYPDLAGLATMAGENPTGCVDFVVDAIAKPVHALRGSSVASSNKKAFPPLLFWTWCSYPEDARKVIDVCPSASLLHYLQYEQWFKPMADPRVRRYAEAVAALEPTLSEVPIVTLGGPKSALGHLLWFDPEWMRDLTIDMRRQGIDGLFLETYCGDAEETASAFGFYGINAGTRYSSRMWEESLANRYGAQDYAPLLLEAIQHASAIVPRFLRLVHSQSDHFMPQFGLPLTYYLEMPTLSSYVFENTQTTDDQDYLTPRLGLTWPNPDWGEKVVSIREGLTRAVPEDATTPEEIANQINHHVTTCRSRLHRLRTLEPDDPGQASRLETLLDRIALNVALGDHYQHKIRAALAWQRILLGKGRSGDCIKPLEASVRAWWDVVEMTDRLYPEPVRYWQSQMVSPPPWTQNQIWRSYRLVEGHWRDQMPRFHRELDLVRQILSLPPERHQLPLWDALNATPDEDLLPFGKITFEPSTVGDAVSQLGKGASITHDKQVIIGGNASMLADTRSLKPGPHVVWTTNAVEAPIPADRPYELSLVYRVIRPGPAGEPAFEFGLRRADGNEAAGDHRFWTAPAGYLGTRIVKTPTLTHTDYQLYITVHHPAAIVIDSITISAPKSF